MRACMNECARRSFAGDGDDDDDDDEDGVDVDVDVDARSVGDRTMCARARLVRGETRGDAETRRRRRGRAHQGAVAERLRPSHPGKRARDG